VSAAACARKLNVQGFDSSYNSWIRLKDMHNADSLIASYEANPPDEPETPFKNQAAKAKQADATKKPKPANRRKSKGDPFDFKDIDQEEVCSHCSVLNA
jgi:hypothetical protein